MTTDPPFGPAPPMPWWHEPRPWMCSRCGIEFGMPDWKGYLGQWLRADIEELDPYGPPLCHHCFAVKRAQSVLFAMPDVEVEPCEPGLATYVADGMWLVVEPDGTVREYDEGD